MVDNGVANVLPYIHQPQRSQPTLKGEMTQGGDYEIMATRLRIYNNTVMAMSSGPRLPASDP